VDGDVLIVFVDTLFDADLALARSLTDEWSGIIWAKEVEDYSRFGVIVTDADGGMTRIVEKPSEPISKLANIGLYYIRDSKLLFEGIDHTIASPTGVSGEFYLTDAFQYMVDHGARIRTAPVGGWYDCGKIDTLLETNHHLLSTTRGGVSPRATVEDSEMQGPVRVEEGATVRGCVLGPNVTVEAGATLEGSVLRDTIVGEGARIGGSRLHDSVIGAHSRVEGMSGSVNVGPHSELRGA
jgi:glucose-1-phosphate thymidylyltransferase